MLLPNNDPNVRKLADEFSIEKYGMNILNSGLKSAQTEANKFIDKQTKNIFGNDSTEGASQRPLPVQMQQTTQQPQKKSSELVNKAKGINPLIYGAIGFGISKLAGLGTMTAAGIGAGTAGGKYLLIDRKQ